MTVPCHACGATPIAVPEVRPIPASPDFVSIEPFDNGYAVWLWTASGDPIEIARTSEVKARTTAGAISTALASYR